MHYSLKTEKAYLYWIRFFIRWSATQPGGMRLMEGMRLRIKDMDFDRHVIIVREAKGGKDRVVMLPRSLASAMHAQLMAARATWETDKQVQRAGVDVPHALEAKYPKVGQTWGWFWLFPSPTLSVDPRSGVERRHHLFEERLQRALKKSSPTGWHLQAGIGAYAAPQLCYTPAAIGYRYPHCSRAAGP